MAYWQLYYHFVWPTLHHKPLLNPATEPVVHALLRQRAGRMGATVYAVGGTDWHVHLVAAVPPRWSPALFVGQLKSQTTSAVHRAGLSAERFAWHEGYGIFSFDRRQLPPLINYVTTQPAVHAHRRTISALELMDGAAQTLIDREQGRFYIDSEAWRKELLALDGAMFDSE